MLSIFSSADEKQFKTSLRTILGFTPSKIILYRRALTHNSVAKEIKEGIKDSNERLEFLGDSVLNMIIAEYLFRKYPYKHEGDLTKMRSKIVSRNHLNKLAMKLGLNKLLVRNSDPGIKQSSMHGDAFEALVGAVFLDKGMSGARDFMLNRILKYHVDVDLVLETETDFKSKLIEWAQQGKKALKFASAILQNEESKEKTFEVTLLLDDESICSASHYSKKRAEQLAAEAACQKIGIG